jgi:hypothetical protein
MAANESRHAPHTGRISMTRRSIAAVAVLACVLSAAVPAAAQPDLSGVYDTAGTNPDGSAYSGETEIARTGEAYRVVQRVGSTAQGTGLVSGDVLAVSFPDAGWVAAYRIRPDGTLEGVWVQSGGSALGRETLTPAGGAMHNAQ